MSKTPFVFQGPPPSPPTFSDVSASALAAAIAAPQPPRLIDVREPSEHATGIIFGALLIPERELPHAIAHHINHKSDALVIYCASGLRSSRAAHALTHRGYTNVRNLNGGLTAWATATLPVVPPPPPPPAAPSRYARQTVLPQLGLAGQDRLAASRVLIVGAGGLGSPAALYLAAAGVGTIGLIDDDRVELTNLQRQILHNEASIGELKVTSAARRLSALNSAVTLQTYVTRLNAANALALIADYDLVVDGSDNLATRYAINDACVATQTPFVYGALYHFEGQVAVFNHGDGPCYRCLYPAPPPPELAPSCAVAGVLGAVCGVIGSLQATAALRVLARLGDPKRHELISIDALNMHVRTLTIARDPRCPSCGTP